MKPATLEKIKAHAAACFPRECCGLVVVQKGKERYVPCRNIAEQDVHFVIHPEDYALAEDMGEITTVVHSHCNLPATPSQPDLVSCELSGKPWMIISWPTGQVVEIQPTGYQAPLIGREFHHGVLDCYSLVKDYYERNLGIQMPEVNRDYEWWLKGQNLYMDYFDKAGFVKVEPDEMREHDGLLMQVGSPVVNHAAVYVGNNQIIQHVMGRLSSRDVFGGWFRKCTVFVARHRSLM